MSKNDCNRLFALVEAEFTIHSLKQFWTDWDTVGGGPCAGLRTMAMQALKGPSVDWHKLLFAADALQELCWEKLHTGHWMDVQVAWRDAYTLFTLLAVVARTAVSGEPAAAAAEQAQIVQEPLQQFCMQQQHPQSAPAVATADYGPDSQAPTAAVATVAGSQQQQYHSLLVEAMKHLDLAAMMGGPRFRTLLDQALAIVDQQLQQGIATAGAASAIADITAQAGLAEDSSKACINANAGGSAECYMMPPAKRRCTEQTSHEVEAGAGTANRGFQAAADLSLLPARSLTATSAVVPVEYCPSIEQFLMKYLLAEGGPVPVVIKGAMKHWPALTKWQDLKYLSKVAGRRTVPVELGQHYLQEGWGTSLMTLDEFIDKHVVATSATGVATSAAEAPTHREAKRQLGYLAQHQLFEQVPALAADVCVPDYCMLGDKGVSSINAWFGPSGTVTPLHQDPENNFLAQVVGCKYVRLYDPQYTAQLYPHVEGMHTNTSRVDVEAVDEALYPEFSDVPYMDVLLEPDSMLYMPPKWWHYIKSVSVSFSVSFWWN